MVKKAGSKRVPCAKYRNRAKPALTVGRLVRASIDEAPFVVVAEIAEIDGPIFVLKAGDGRTVRVMEANIR